MLRSKATHTSMSHGSAYTRHSPGFISDSATIPGAGGLLDKQKLSLSRG